jgi:copper homeostasis protein (lipoprotein)
MPGKTAGVAGDDLEDALSMKRTFRATSGCAVLLALLGAGCTSASAVDSTVRGTATYLEKIGMPPGAVLEVALEDVSMADAPAATIARVRLENVGNPPYDFEIPYDAERIDERRTYNVRARLLVDGTLWFVTDTHTPVVTRGAGSEVSLIMRRVAGTDAPRSTPLGVLPATFEGVLPCADCEGIRYHLDLFEDEAFFLRTTYLGRGDDGIFDDIGTWVVSSERERLALFGGREAPVMFRIVDRGTLRKLDLEGHEIATELNYDLTRHATFDPVEPQLHVRGMYRYMADAALFEECLTGKRFPVSFEADNIALERGYRDSGVEPGQPILVSLEGRIAERPAMEGDASVMSLVPERFIGAWPGETCGARMATAELLDTYWKLTRLGDRPVIVHRDQREPHLILRSDGDRVSGFGGCNRLAGGFELDGSSIAFAQLASTMMACPEGMDTEQALSAALGEARSWRLVGTHLELFNGEGEMVARFEARHLD